MRKVYLKKNFRLKKSQAKLFLFAKNSHNCVTNNFNMEVFIFKKKMKPLIFQKNQTCLSYNVLNDKNPMKLIHIFLKWMQTKTQTLLFLNFVYKIFVFRKKNNSLLSPD